MTETVFLPGTAGTPLVSVVLVNYKTPAMTLDCLESLSRHCRSVPAEIIVADNNSGDDSVERLRKSSVPLVVVPMPVNLGFGGGCNAGARLARGRYIYLLNTDTLMRDDNIRILVDFLEQKPAAVAVGSRLCYPDGTRQRSAFNFPSPWRVFFGAEGIGEALERRFPFLGGKLSMFVPDERLARPCRVDWCHGASLMFRADAYRQVGGFDEGFFMYAEELDLCRRLTPLGEIWYTPETTVVHFEGASHAEGPISDRRMGYMAAGRRRYYQKHHSFLGAALCNLADGGGSLAKGAVLWLMALFNRNPKVKRRAALQLTYARNYFKYTYPLPPAQPDVKS